MQTLIIQDLVRTEELDRQAMTAVRGGTGMGYPSCAPSYSPCAPSTPSGWSPMSGFPKGGDFSFNATQQLGQSQSTVVNNGNNVAFASGISATVNPTQYGTNNINFGHY